MLTTLAFAVISEVKENYILKIDAIMWRMCDYCKIKICI